MGGVTVVVATYGNESVWGPRSLVAVASAIASGADDVISVHGTSLHDSRNGAVARVETEWMIHLDADDTLPPGYCDVTRDLIGCDPVADVHVPAVAYTRGGRRGQPGIPRVSGHTHDCEGECLPYGNWIVIGAPVRARFVRDTGGWRDWPVYEDWCMWLRMFKAGAVFRRAPGLVYEAVTRPRGRNRAGRSLGLDTHRRIATEYGVPVP